MPTLREILIRHVPPPREAPLLDVIATAEAEAACCSPLCAAALLAHVESKVQVGAWGMATARALRALGGAPESHPLSRWIPLLSPGEETRGVDRWVLPYEATMRHHGLEPPEGTCAAYRVRITSHLERLRDAVLAALPEDLVLEGAGRDTTARIGGLRFGVSPLLEVRGDALWMWNCNGARRRPGEWLSVRWGADGVVREAVSDPTATGWRDAGVLGRLRRRGAPHPLARFVGDKAAPSAAGVAVLDAAGPERRSTLVVRFTEPAAYAELVATRTRTAARPVVVVPIGAGDDALARLTAVLDADDASAATEALRSWSSSAGRAPALVLAACSAADVDGLESLSLACAGVAHVVVVASKHAHDQSPELHHRWRASPPPFPEPDGVVPDTVAALLWTGLDAPEAWRRGLEASLRTGASEGDEDLVFLAKLLQGHEDLLSLPQAPRTGTTGAEEPFRGARGLAWWQRSLLDVKPDGHVELAHPGFAALAAGMLSGADGARAPGPPDPHASWPDAWRAGVELAARIAPALAAPKPGPPRLEGKQRTR
jgi:hypothetical protein